MGLRILLCALVATGALLSSATALNAHTDKESDASGELFSKEIKFSMTLYAFNVGSAHIFVPADKSTEAGASSYESHDIIGVTNYNEIEMFFYGSYMEVLMTPYWRHSAFLQAPESNGLKAEILIPLRFLSPDLRIGLCHDSAHNSDTGKYGGRGTDITGTCARFRFTHATWRHDFWAMASIPGHNVVSPYIVMHGAEPFSRSSLDITQSMAGLDSVTEFGHLAVRVHEVTRQGSDGPASISLSAEALYNPHFGVAFGGIVIGHHNLRERERFGGSEGLVGFKIEFPF